MDPLTHGVLGASLGWIVAGRRLGARAALAGGVAGMLPDLDLLLRPVSDPALPWEYHRHFSHALLFTPVGALAAAIPFALLRAGRGVTGARGILYLACAAGYLSHSVLDNATSWGTQWFWPFSPARIAWDAIAIIDPVFSALLLAGLVAGLWRRRAAPAVTTLLLCALYLGLGAAQHGRAGTALRAAAAARGHHVDRLRIVPTLANIVLWRGLYTSGGELHAAAVRTPFLRPARVGPVQSLRLVEAGALLEMPGARHPRVAETFPRFAAMADGYTAMTPGHPAIVGDMRYSLEPGGFAPLWGLRIGPAEGDAAGEEPVAWVDLLEEGPSFLERVIGVLRQFS